MWRGSYGVKELVLGWDGRESRLGNSGGLGGHRVNKKGGSADVRVGP